MPAPEDFRELEAWGLVERPMAAVEEFSDDIARLTAKGVYVRDVLDPMPASIPGRTCPSAASSPSSDTGCSRSRSSRRGPATRWTSGR